MTISTWVSVLGLALAVIVPFLTWAVVSIFSLKSEVKILTIRYKDMTEKHHVLDADMEAVDNKLNALIREVDKATGSHNAMLGILKEIKDTVSKSRNNHNKAN
jgi:low affinity Fe/Cu permease